MIIFIVLPVYDIDISNILVLADAYLGANCIPFGTSGIAVWARSLKVELKFKVKIYRESKWIIIIVRYAPVGY